MIDEKQMKHLGHLLQIAYLVDDFTHLLVKFINKCSIIFFGRHTRFGMRHAIDEVIMHHKNGSEQRLHILLVR